MTSDYRLGLLSDLRTTRRRIASDSVAVFARIYLGAHFRLPPSRMHRELFGMLNEATGVRGQRLAIAAPRGHAKTTVTSLAYVLWSALYGKEPFIVLVSATRDQAIALLRAVKLELETNPLLLEDFPDIVPSPEQRRRLSPWTESQLLLPNGVAIRALGAEQRMRGAKHRQHRPSLIIADDLEDQDRAASEEQRRQLRDWFERTLLKLSDPSTNVVVVGTIVHHDALLAHLTGATGTLSGTGTGWTTQTFRAVVSFSARADLWDTWESILLKRQEFEGEHGPGAAARFLTENHAEMMRGTEVLWPELEDYPRLMTMRALEGHPSFSAEKQNQPLDPRECLFREEMFSYWDTRAADAAELLAKLGRDVRIFGACDPSLGRRGGRGDYSAIVTLVQDTREDRLYVIGADVAQRTPEETVSRIVELRRIYEYATFAFEANGFQELLIKNIDDRCRAEGRYMRIEPITNVGDKQGRIQSLQPLVAQGKLVFTRRHIQLLEQLRQFPLGAHDDGPDALEMAVRAAQHGHWEVGWVSI